MACVWGLNLTTGFDVVMSVFGLVAGALGVTALGWSRLVQHRLDVLQDRLKDRYAVGPS